VLNVLGTEAFVADTGTGEPCVLLHGNPDTHAVWTPVIERIAPRLRCYAPDLPGFGQTRVPAGFDFSLASQGEWVGALLDALGLERVHLVVHDVGGPHGLAFATEHAARLRSLTIFNTIFFPDYHWHFWARVWRTRGLGELAMAIMNRPLFVHELQRGSPHIPRAYADRAYDEITPEMKQAVLRWYRAMDPSVWRGWDTRLLAATRSIPTQVVWGDLDPYLPSRFADRFGGTVTHVPDCGHWVMLENPDVCAAKIAV
jgi:pimeloyl-ACP methyl ester carboxylesterase